MTSEQIFLLVIVVAVIALVFVVALIQVRKYRNRIRRIILNLLKFDPETEQHSSNEPDQPFTGIQPMDLTVEQSKDELDRLQKLVEDRKQIARDTDISHHLWGLYKILVRYTSPHSLDRYLQDGEWFELNILHVEMQNDLKNIEFELKGSRYKFVDDEEKQGWCMNMKTFSLFLYDDSDHCLIEIPMRMRVEGSGRLYSISSGGPKAFLSGDWVSDFINVTLKHQYIRNQEIRAQKHEERLCEIKDLKDRYGIYD